MLAVSLCFIESYDVTAIQRNSVMESFLAQQGYAAPGKSAAQKPETAPSASPIQDQRPPETVLQGLAAAQPRLISESVDNLDRGFRRTQIFRQSDGRDFSRDEETLLTPKGFTRTVTQRNPSGSFVRFEEIFERQEDGTFRRTQHYIDEAGKAETKIATGINEPNVFVLSDGLKPPVPKSPFDRPLGNALDISV